MDGRRVKKWDGEASTHERVVQYLRRHYPNIIFRTDYAAGIQLPIWLAKRQKSLQFKRGFPDIFIFQPVIHENQQQYHGLALELKAKGVEVLRQNGNWVQEHFKEQFDMLTLLKDQGYAASFARGYDEATAVIDWYLQGDPVISFDDHLLPLVHTKHLDDNEIF